MPVFIGIDPGTGGGLACVADDGVETCAMPRTLQEVWEWVRWHEPGMNPLACVEMVTGYVGSGPGGVKAGGQPGSMMFKFGANYGALLMALTAAAVPYTLAHPAKWQRDLGISPRRAAKSPHGAESKPEFKRRLLHFSQRLYPAVKVTLKTCDALLLAHYAKMLYEKEAQRWPCQ